MNNQAVVERQDTAPANIEQHPASDAEAMMAMISRAATDPNFDPDKMERLLQMHERITEREAKKAYVSAFAAMQQEMPEMPENGMIRIVKDDKVRQETPYALWEDINEAIKPLLKKHGFALSFRTGQGTDGRVSVTAVLMHVQGHSEETTIFLQHDTSGSKNAVQAIGSSTSYGKRYAAMALLNITSRTSEDDDGKAAGVLKSKQDAREPYKEMQAEIDACETQADVKRLWNSKAFQGEYERLPNDWKTLLTQRADERWKELANAPRGTVPPNFDNL